MSAPERHVLRGADLADLTGLELFQALAQAGLTKARYREAVGAILDPEGDPALALQGYRFLQAVSLALAIREGSTATWDEAQRWDVQPDLSDEGEDPLTVERREYRVAAALVTGLDPDRAEALPLADVAEYARRRA